MRSRFAEIAIPLLLITFASPTFATEKYALLIGVNKCEGFDPLNYAERDMTELAQQLKVIGYRTIIVMVNGSGDIRRVPTRENIMEKLKDLTQFPINKDDHVLVALSGHGVQFNNQPYFCATDSDPNKGGNAGDPTEDKRLIAISEVQLALKNIPAQLKLLLCDACRDTLADAKGSKGPADATTAFNSTKQYPESVAQTVPQPSEIRAKGSYGLFSCMAGQRAYEDAAIQHSYFFFYVIKGLKGEADKTRDGKIYLFEFSQYVAENVSQDVYNKNKGTGQKPELGAEGIDFTDGPIAIIPERLVSWSPGEIWKEGTWEPKGDITTAGRDEKRFYPEIVRKVSVPETDKPIEVSFLLIEDPYQPFYMMKNKVSCELFHCFARQNPDKLHRTDERHETDSPWLKWIAASEATDPQWPAFHVTFSEAQAFAEWLGGKIPTEKQWDSAAGLDDWIEAGRMPADAGPFEPPIGRPVEIALGGMPRPVGSARDDFSRLLVRDMAGNGKEWTSAIFNEWHILRGHSYEQDRPLTFKQIMETSAGICAPQKDSAYTTFRVVLDSLK